MAHSLEPRRTSSHRFERRATTPACASSSDLYTRPQASDTLPVYEDVTLEWNPGCVTIGSSTVDLYLSVEESSGWLAVHEWTNVQYAAGKLDTQLKPGWWNASTGAGQVSAQVRCCDLSSSSSETPADLFGGSCTLDLPLFSSCDWQWTALDGTLWTAKLEHARASRTRLCYRLQRIASLQSTSVRLKAIANSVDRAATRPSPSLPPRRTTPALRSSLSPIPQPSPPLLPAENSVRQSLSRSSSWHSR